MKTFLSVSLLVGIALFASLPRRTCYQGDFQGYRVQVDTVTRLGVTTSFVVLRPNSETLSSIKGVYTGAKCEFLTLSNPHRFAAEPANSSDTRIKQAWSLLETARVAVQRDEYIVRPAGFSFWRFVPLKFL